MRISDWSSDVALPIYDAFGGVDDAEGLARWNRLVRTQGVGNALGQRQLALHELVHHDHVDVGSIGAHLRPQVVRPFDHVDASAYPPGRVGQLLPPIHPLVRSEERGLLQAWVSTGRSRWSPG